MILMSQLLPALGDFFRKARVLQSTPTNNNSRSLYGEKYLKRLLWYLLGGTRGGANRVEILKTLQNRPCNANQLASVLQVDYKEKGAYGAVLFLTPKMEEAIPILDEIWSKIGRRKISANPRGAV